MATPAKFYFQFAVFALVLIVVSEQCMNLGPNLGLGNIGAGNVGVGNVGWFNNGVFNRGFRNTGALNQKAASTIGVANYRTFRRLGVMNYIAVPNPGPVG